MKLLLRLPISAICAVGLVVLHFGHVLIHNTPLDSGTLDASVQYLTIFFQSNMNTR